MSKEQASEFLKKVSADKDAAEKFKEAFRAALVKTGKDVTSETLCLGSIIMDEKRPLMLLLPR